MLPHPVLLEPRQWIVGQVLVVDYRPYLLQGDAGLVHEVTHCGEAVERCSLDVWRAVELECGIILRDQLLLLRCFLEWALISVERRLNCWTAKSLLHIVCGQVGPGRHQLFIFGLQDGLLVGHGGEHVPAELLPIV